MENARSHIPETAEAILVVRGSRDQESRSHRHAEGQFVLVKHGCLNGGTDTQQWLLRAGMAVWIPPWHTHWGQGEGGVELAVLYVAPAQCGRLPDDVTPLKTNPLIDALTNRLLETTNSPQRARMFDLLIDEIAAAEPDGLVLPLPQDRRLQPIAAALLRDPAQRRTLAEWAQRLGATERTLARLFKRETGLSYTAWCHQLRMREALRGLVLGMGNVALAEALGFSSADGFSHWFRKQMRQSPQAARKTL